MNANTLAAIDLFAETPAFNLKQLKQQGVEKAELKKLKNAIKKDCRCAHRSEIDKQMRIPLLYILEHTALYTAIQCMGIDWFIHRPKYIQFVTGCAVRADKYTIDEPADGAAAAARTAAAAARTATNATAAAYAAAHAAAYATAAAYAARASVAAAVAAATAERANQKQHLVELLTS